MTKSYKEAMKAARKAAALERQKDDYRKDAGYRAIYNQDTPIGEAYGG